jgi:hypothetical protein
MALFKFNCAKEAADKPVIAAMVKRSFFMIVLYIN